MARYIDADKLTVKLNETQIEFDRNYYGLGEAKRPKDCPRDAVQTTHLLQYAKLIVHAHWIEGQTDNPNIHNILCSHCFSGYPSKGHANSQYTKKRFKWCPSCGAKMDENERKLKYADENTMMSAT